MEYLKEQKSLRKLHNLVLIPFQDYERLSNVLASADVLLTILEPTASRFSVPSKVLTYLCAERAQVAICPGDNLVARIIEDSGGGVVIHPEHVDQLTRECVRLLDNYEVRTEHGRKGRSYAEAHFDVAEFARRLEQLARALVGATNRLVK